MFKNKKTPPFDEVFFSNPYRELHGAKAGVDFAEDVADNWA